MKIDISYHITGNYPLRQISVEEATERNEPGYVVGFQRGFEQLQVAVWGDGLSVADAEEAAIEFLQKNYPDSIKADATSEEISCIKLPVQRKNSLNNVDLIRDGLQSMIETSMQVDDHRWAAAIERAQTNRPLDAARKAQTAIEGIDVVLASVAAELTRILCICDADYSEKERFENIKIFAAKARDEINTQIK